MKTFRVDQRNLVLVFLIILFSHCSNKTFSISIFIAVQKLRTKRSFDLISHCISDIDQLFNTEIITFISRKTYKRKITLKFLFDTHIFFNNFKMDIISYIYYVLV